ncbi:MAG: hypothetical protein PUB13_04800 [Lachnospiraceae bacterium]|nr:hypothetical protein [Lachnospiraceae bacterium]
MTAEDREFLNTIMEYADKVMPDIDPQKVRISEQLEKLRPILQELAMKHKMNVEDVFIKYMDLATEHAVKYNNEMNEKFMDAISPEES